MNKISSPLTTVAINSAKNGQSAAFSFELSAKFDQQDLSALLLKSFASKNNTVKKQLSESTQQEEA